MTQENHKKLFKLPKFCPWCGKPLEVKAIAIGNKIRLICAKCGYKIKEFDKPQPPKEEPKSEVVEIKQEEVPIAKQAPAWPFILGAIVLILIIITLIKIFLV